VAAQARQAGALTVGVVTRPFAFEGPRRREIADEAARALATRVDTLIVVPNDGVRNVVLGDLPMLEAFRIVDDLLRQGIEGIVELIGEAGFINLDFADVRSVMKDAGPAVLGVGRAVADGRATEAARAAIVNQLVGGGITGARAVLLQVAGPPDLTLSEVTQAAEVVRTAADPEANVVFGATFDERLDDAVQVTVIATGFAATGPADGGSRAARAERNASRSSSTSTARGTAADAGAAPEDLRATAPVASTANEPTADASDQEMGSSPDPLDIPTVLRRR
jgi:cell division protein FtsZ